MSLKTMALPQKLFQITQLIDDLVRLAERLFGPKTGALKKEWVRAVLIYALTALKDVDLPINDLYEFLIDRLIEIAVGRLQAYGEPVPQPEPVPVPTPVPVPEPEPEPIPEPGPPDPPPPPPIPPVPPAPTPGEGALYNFVLMTEPDWGAYPDGALVFVDDPEQIARWYVVPAGATNPFTPTTVRELYARVLGGALELI